MTDLCDDWVVSVTRALPEPLRMHMDIGDHLERALAAALPDSPELSTVELHDAIREARVVDIVVEKELDYLARTLGHSAQQECAALATSCTAAPQLRASTAPEAAPAGETSRFTEQPLQQCSD